MATTDMTTFQQSEVAKATVGEGTLAAAGGSLTVRFHNGPQSDSGNNNLIAGATAAITFSDLATFDIISATIADIVGVGNEDVTGFSIHDGTNTRFYGPYVQTWSVGETIEFVGTEIAIAIGGNSTEYLAQKISDSLRNIGSYINATPRAALWVAVPPTDGTVGANEAADATYARLVLSWAAEGGDGIIETDTDADFGAWTAPEEPTHSGIIDEAGGDDVLFTNPILGVDEATNGVFSADSDWTKSANATITGGVLRYTGAQSGDEITFQSLGTINDGSRYQVVFDVVNYTTGNAAPIVGGDEGVDVNDNGTFTQYVIAGSSNEDWGFIVDVNFDGDIDNVTIKKAHAKMDASKKIRFESSNFIFQAT